ncbi:hypothetical protein REPUB_Repub02eG0111200 [Reevesia pubescens]
MELDPQHYARLLQSFKTQNSIILGNQLHLFFFEKGILSSTLTIGNRLRQMYARCGTMAETWKLFDEMPHKNCFSWNTIIEGYMKSGNKEQSLEFFKLMSHKNDFSWNFVISGFAKAGELEVARALFDDMPRKNWVAWNSMIHDYARNGDARKAVELLKDLGSLGDVFVLATVIRACLDWELLNMGNRFMHICSLCIYEHVKQMHGHAQKVGLICDFIVASTLIHAYSKCGRPTDACKFFSELQAYDTILLNSMITVYSSCGRIEDAKQLFKTIPNQSMISWNSMIVGLSQNGCPVEALDD